MLIPVIAIALAIATGLYLMSRWGYWLTLSYAVYLLVVPPIMVGKEISVFGNVIWPIIVLVYLLLVRKRYFSTDVQTSESALDG